jgi:phage-related protein (TIGR01555 family)
MSVSLTIDSWYNPVTGVGGPKDKTAGFTFAPFQQYDWDYPQFLRALYERDELAAIKVDAVVDDAFAKGWSVEASGLTPEQTEAAIDLNDKLKIREAITQAVKWARLFGGGAVFLGSTDGPLESPLVSGGQLLFARPHERDELYPSRWYDDPLSPKFGKPSHYRLQPHSSIGGMTSKIRATHIHESRFLLFYGAETTQQRRVENLGWGSSVLLRAMTALKQFNSIYALGVSLFADANQNVYKLKGFADLALAGRTDAVEKRIAMIEQFRSAVHALIVDADSEDFVRSQLSLSGMDGVFTQYKERLAAAFQMPLTRLLGVSPAGLNATGESDERNWHKQVASFQEDVLRPALEKWMRVAYAASNGPTQGRTPDSFKVKFPALRDVTPREQAEIDSINMQTDTGYHLLGVLDVPTIAEARFSAEPTRPTLDNEQLAALKAATSLTDTVPVESLVPGAEVAATEDAIAVDDGPDHDLLSFIEQMNQHNVERCPHEKRKRCRICGMESVHSVSRDATGAAVFAYRWRPIGSLGVDPNAGRQEPEAQTGQTTD